MAVAVQSGESQNSAGMACGMRRLRVCRSLLNNCRSLPKLVRFPISYTQVPLIKVVEVGSLLVGPRINRVRLPRAEEKLGGTPRLRRECPVQLQVRATRHGGIQRWRGD